METFFVIKVSTGFLPPLADLFFCYLYSSNTTTLCMAAPKQKSFFKKLLRFFLQGLVILAPIGVTAWVLWWLFSKVDNILRPYVDIPGLGFVIIIVFVLLVGWVSSTFLMGSVINFFDQWVERAPVIKFIYSSTKEFFEAFSGDKKKFDKPILANAFADDVWVMGFLTDEEMTKFDMGAEMVAIYIPQAYHWAGQLYVLPRSRVRKIDKVSSGDVMKYAVTGGVVNADEEKEKPMLPEGETKQ